MVHGLSRRVGILELVEDRIRAGTAGDFAETSKKRREAERI
jgi:hypothetical protein